MPIGARGVGDDQVRIGFSERRARRWKRAAIAVSIVLHGALLMTMFWKPGDPPAGVVFTQSSTADMTVTLTRAPPKPPAAVRIAEAKAPPPPIVAPPKPAPQHRAKPAHAAPAPEAPSQMAVAAPAAAEPAPSHEPPLILHPRFRTTPVPAVYPPRAMELNQQGDVLVRAIIDTSGEPQTVNLWRGSGFPMLDAAALEAVRRWRFLPAEVNGVAVTAIVQVPVVFHLK